MIFFLCTQQGLKKCPVRLESVYWQHCQDCNPYPCCVSVPASQMCTWEFFKGTAVCTPYPKPAMLLFFFSSADSKSDEQFFVESQVIFPLCHRKDRCFYIWLKFSLHSLVPRLSNRATFLHSSTASPSGEVGTGIWECFCFRIVHRLAI